jgi:CheY-like chemotaxis protein
LARILVVDDDATTRRLIGSIVAPGGHVIVEAGSGLEAIDRFKSFFDAGEPIDLVLSDVDMPGGDGIELHMMLDLNLAGCHFVLMTGLALDPDRVTYAHDHGLPLFQKGSKALQVFIKELRNGEL